MSKNLLDRPSANNGCMYAHSNKCDVFRKKFQEQCGGDCL